MSNRGGLQGKARRVFHERRAARLQAHQMIEEYFEPQDRLAKHYSHIPLPLVARVEIEPKKSITKASPNTESIEHEPRILRFPTVMDGKAETQVEQLAPTTTTIQPSALKKPQTIKPWHTSKPRPFSMKGFLSGCAIGTAAAVAVLSTLWVIIR